MFHHNKFAGDFFVSQETSEKALWHFKSPPVTSFSIDLAMKREKKVDYVLRSFP